MRTIIGLEINKNKATAAVVQVVEEFQFATDTLGLQELKQLIVAGGLEAVTLKLYSKQPEYFF